MLNSPFRFEETFTDADFQKVGLLALRWSHIEHIVGNCLRVMLRLSDEEAVVVIFPLTLESRLTRIKNLAELSPLNEDAQNALAALTPAIAALQIVRNGLIHAVVHDDQAGSHVFENRAKGRVITKAELFSTEELTNYAAHAVISLRYALGFKDSPAERYPLPDRPEIPEFLRSFFPAPKTQKSVTPQSPPQSSPA